MKLVIYLILGLAILYGVESILNKPKESFTVPQVSTYTQMPVPTLVPRQTQKNDSYTNVESSSINNSKKSEFSCDCSKTCKQISTCAEAQFQLNNCGCSIRDGDNDGIACDRSPLNCQK